MQDDHKDNPPPEPDYGSSLVWSTDAKKQAQLLLDNNGGNVNKSLKKLFGGSTSRETAMLYAEAFAGGLGLTYGEFMFKYDDWTKGKLRG
jgi:hypothetical protein